MTQELVQDGDHLFVYLFVYLNALYYLVQFYVAELKLLSRVFERGWWFKMVYVQYVIAEVKSFKPSVLTKQV